MPFIKSTLKQKRFGPVKKSHAVAPSASQAVSLKEQIVQIVAIVVIAAVVAHVGFRAIGWISEYFKPFCDTDQAGDCIPCPEHGICSGNQVQCLPGFKRQGRSCVHDLKIDENAQKLVAFVQDYVCSKHAQALCDGLGSVWIPRDELVEVIKDAWFEKQFGEGNEILPLVQERAFRFLQELLAVRENAGREEFQCLGHLVESYKPFGCWLREKALSNIVYLLLSGPLVVFGTSLFFKLLRRWRIASRALSMYAQVCEELEERALNADGQDNVAWVVPSHLRDHLLSVRERKNTLLWNEVERLVNEDSRIDQYPKLIKGESKTVWEWQVQGALRSPAMKRLGQRVRFAASSSPLQRTEPTFQKQTTTIPS